MNILLPIIILLLLAVVYAGSLNNSKSRLCVVLGVLIIILLLCWYQLYSSRSNNIGSNINNGISNSINSIRNFDKFQNVGYAPINYKLMVSDDDVNSQTDINKCDSLNYRLVNDTISPLGTYDGLMLPSVLNSSPLMKTPIFITSPRGEDIALTQDMNSNSFPSVDGTLTGDKHLFVFANNTSGNNCRSQYSTSTGQVCLSPEQIQMFSGRGTNNSKPGAYPYL